MHRKAIALWEAMTVEERFRFMLELDKRYRAGDKVGNGLRNLQVALTRKVLQAKEIDTERHEHN